MWLIPNCIPIAFCECILYRILCRILCRLLCRLLCYILGCTWGAFEAKSTHAFSPSLSLMCSLLLSVPFIDMFTYSEKPYDFTRISNLHQTDIMLFIPSWVPVGHPFIMCEKMTWASLIFHMNVFYLNALANVITMGCDGNAMRCDQQNALQMFLVHSNLNVCWHSDDTIFASFWNNINSNQKLNLC